VPKALVYDRTLYIMAGLLLVGLICNFFVHAVDPSHYMSETDLARERGLQHETVRTGTAETAARGPIGATGIIAWLAVGVPFAIGLYIALSKAAGLF
jgi:hypothetical protein